MTSEQKLLQLIRRSSKERKVVQPKPAAEPAGGISEHQWRLVNRWLMAAAVVFAGIVIARYVSWRSAPAPVVPKMTQTDSGAPESIQERSASFSEDRNIFLSRNVFQAAGQQNVSEELPGETPVEAVPQIDLNQQYRIVGIVLGEKPTAIVENIQTSSTVFLGIGDPLDAAVVKEIREDRIILELNGQAVELRS